MQGRDGPPLIHSNRYSAASACRHCDGVIRHEPWCITQNTNVHFAYQLIADPAHLSVEDRLIRHRKGERRGR
jgi:glycerol-3-phosphate cytidylyltransferase-like family protein